ncbi:hypothetical protein ABZ897_16930 [Nonomuraea sp. NPDC046802]|uniref:hypothetical protein n=1 Tax=Nonomuraea sp. NPDC046802 TaxID=3154919 RepID=UPI0033D7EACA
MALAPAAGAETAASWIAYHNVNASAHVERVKRLKEQGYRPITVNVSDGERYAAVWVKDGSSDEWGMWQSMSPNGFQRRFDAGLREGVQPVSISATGSGDSTVFTAIFAKQRGKFFVKTNLTADGFAEANKKAYGGGLALTSVDVYGTPGDVRYVGVWSTNTGGAWAYSSGKSRQAHEAYFNARKKQGYRPVQVATGPDGTYTAIWRKDGKKPWAHYVDMSSSGFQKRFNDLKAKGLAPVSVNAEGGKYAAVWE